MTATGMRRLRFTSRTISIGLTLDLGGAGRHVAGGVIEVQLEAVRAGLLEQSGVGDPSARCDAVERRHHRNPDGRFDQPQMFQVLVGAERHDRLGRVASPPPQTNRCGFRR